MRVSHVVIGLGLCMIFGASIEKAGAEIQLRHPSNITPSALFISDISQSTDGDAAVTDSSQVAEDGVNEQMQLTSGGGDNVSIDECFCDECVDSAGCRGLGLVDAWLTHKPIRRLKSGLKNGLGIDTGGWVQFGLTGNAQNPADNFNGPVFANDRSGEGQMNELWLYFSRPVDTGGDGFDLGGRIDLLYGTDWRAALFHGFGLEDKINGSDQLYGFSPAQFYGEVGINNLSVKVGRMTGVLGYEVVPPMLNFFYSRSYAITYGEPILITGAMAKYKLGDQWTLLGGAHRGIHRFEDNNDKWNFQGGVMWTSCDQRTSLAYGMDIGQNDFYTGLFGLEDEYIHSIVFKYQLTERMLYVLQHDLGAGNGVNGYEDADWYSVGQYLLYTINDRWSAGARLEWFRDDDGTRIVGLGNLPAKGWNGLPGFNGAFTNLSLGLNWKPKINILVRPEVRWDWYDGSTNLMGQLPFDAGNSSDQLTASLDVVLMF